MPQLPTPATPAEMHERLQELDNVFACDAWEGIERTPEERALLRRYAVGEIGLSAFREQAARIAS